MKLRTKFSLLTCTLAVVVVLGVSSFLYIAEKQLLLKEMKENRNNIINGLAEVSRESLITSNEIVIINYINKLKDTRGLKYAMLTTPEGEILAHTDIQLLGNKVRKPLEINISASKEFFTQKYVNENNIEISAVSLPVSVDGKARGIVWVGFSQIILNKLVDETLQKTRKRIYGVASIGLLIGFLGAIILSSMMTKPIKKMAKGAESIGQGKLDTVIQVTSKDELGNLARDLNKMAKKLAELDQMKQDFLSSITHEFRSPLNAMGIHFDLLFKGHLGELNDKQKDSLSILKNNSSRLGMFIDDLLDVAKLERGKMVINGSLFNLSPIIRETADFYKVQADQKSISLKTESADELPQVYADPDRTRQILTNLLNNAIKFTPENGEIIIDAGYQSPDSSRLSGDLPMRQDAGFVEVSVKDSGMGIPEDQLGTIFNKFEQVKGIRNKVVGQKGTGLGLAIVKGIVEGQGGNIRVESEPGKGTTFFFTIPTRRNTENG